jgi:hypothetical protein
MTMTHWFRAPNPLLEKVREYEDRAAFAAAVDWDPLRGLDRCSLTFEEKVELLVAEKKPLKPTTKALNLAYTVYGMVRSHYRRINPTLVAVRRGMAEELQRRDEDFLGSKLELASGACLLVVKGPTGTAKSVSIGRACEILGQQVSFHLRNDAAGWLKATQIKYLIVPMSHDGSRGGFLLNILLAIDVLLGTDYASELPKECKTVERLFGRVVKLLRHTLLLGVLVIEEIQLDNIVLSSDAKNMQLFLLSLANCGIPLVLVGNSKGFSWLSNMSQDARRMAERQKFPFHPCGALGDDVDEWDTAVFPGIERYYLLDEGPHANCGATLKCLCGGVPGIGLAIWCQAQVEALFCDRGSLTPDDLKATFKDETFDDIRDFAEGFAEKDPAKLLRWRDEDVDVDFYATRWGKPLPAREEDSPLAKKAPTGRKSNKPSASTALRQQQTRRARTELKRGAVKQTLTEGDMRAKGLVAHHLASLAQLRRTTEGKV